MNIKDRFLNRTHGSYLALVSTVLNICITIGYYVTTTKVNNFNNTVFICLLISVIAGIVYYFINKEITEIMILVSVSFTTLAMGMFAANSINTFADVLTGITMFGSSGGIQSIVIILVAMILSIILQIVSSFLKRDIS